MDPQTGRFLNADVYCDTGTCPPLSTNLFAYCENNPINFADSDGYKITATVKHGGNSYKLKIKLPWKIYLIIIFLVSLSE